MKAGTLEVPEASLYYEVRGSGPVLLMIPGGAMDADGFASLADGLADRYTVVTYDCRGNSRSQNQGPREALMVTVFADDAHRLLAAVGPEPAYVFGSSGGAIYGLDLAARYPDQVRALVAHEPPVAALLPDAAHWHAFTHDIPGIYERDGVFPALRKFGAGVGLGAPEAGAGPSPGSARTLRRMMANLELFVGYLVPVITNFEPDIEALRASPARIVVGAGEQSAGQFAYRTALALALELGIQPAYFPGGHGGFASHPDMFAARLHRALSHA